MKLKWGRKNFAGEFTVEPRRDGPGELHCHSTCSFSEWPKIIETVSSLKLLYTLACCGCHLMWHPVGISGPVPMVALILSYTSGDVTDMDIRFHPSMHYECLMPRSSNSKLSNSIVP